MDTPWYGRELAAFCGQGIAGLAANQRRDETILATNG